MKVKELGEFGLVKHLAKIAYEIQGKETAAGKQLLIGIGDDAAVWHGDILIELATADSFIQDIHFTLAMTSWNELGWKALATNLSDIAAMGGVPNYALVSLALPDDTEVEDVTNLYRGMMELGQQFDIAIIGGDTSSSPLVSINITVLGSTKGEDMHILTRSAAKPGDKITVTGYLGAAAAGLEMLSKKIKISPEASTSLKKAFFRPEPRIAEGHLLVEQGVKTAIDISDGLVSDLSHILKASRVGARIEIDRVPIHPAVKTNFGDRAIELALSGGEDYELLFTASADVIGRISEKSPLPITIIGDIVADKIGEITLTDRQGKSIKPAKPGWEHFATS